MSDESLTVRDLSPAPEVSFGFSSHFAQSQTQPVAKKEVLAVAVVEPGLCFICLCVKDLPRKESSNNSVRT
jgi:hypothetical protein